MARSKRSKRTMQLNTLKRNKFIMPVLLKQLNRRSDLLKKRVDGGDLEPETTCVDELDSNGIVVAKGTNWQSFAKSVLKK